MDKYVKIKKIGEGSFGKALLVRSKENGKQLVVKEINMNKMSRKERDESRKEVAVLGQLDHSNIVAYKESFEEIGNLYIVMDYCDGGDLYGKINSQRGILLPEDQILDWFVQTCLAIKHIHDRKILHRDIKSQNIFLTRHGICKLGDFGIAKVLNSTVELARTCIGTPYYLSPEIVENKPYNNKSDVWSLGCVLYELVTLKHAFEAGNMKNLVLKIIRGSYPPPSPRYTYELRSLISLLFKRSPRERPSINSVLKKNILQGRIRRFLSESEIADEFSHTVMHGMKIKKQLPLDKPRPLPPKPVPARRTPVPATPPRYDPASIYAPSAARKSGERRSVEVRKSSADRRPPSAGVRAAAPPSNQDLLRRKQELLEKERKRREDARKKEQNVGPAAAYSKQHRDLVEKQRNTRMQRAREEGWKCVLESSDKDNRGQPKRKEEPKPSRAVTPQEGVADKDRASYEQYHAYLDKLQKDRQARLAAPHVAGGGVAGALGGGAFNPAVAANRGQAAGARGGDAAQKARQLEEFMQRKQEAALNKARAVRDLQGRGGVAAVLSPRVDPQLGDVSQSDSRPASAQRLKDKAEEEYLAKLRQIRLQNFNERRVKEKGSPKADPKYKPPIQNANNDQELRRKKIEALRAQADEKARKLKEELERKRKVAYDAEQRRLRDQAPKGKADKSPSSPMIPAKPVPLTEAFRAIGAAVPVTPPPPQLEKCPIGMTAAMEAIGAAKPAEPEVPEESRSVIQKRKEEILKRLNSKPPTPEKPRGKWGQPVQPTAAGEAPGVGEGAGPPAADRPKWGAPASNLQDLHKRPLADTAVHMTATGAGDVVAEAPGAKAAADTVASSGGKVGEEAAGRRQWGGPPGTLLSALQNATLADTVTVTVATPSDNPLTSDEPKAEQTPGGLAPGIGSTITIGRSPSKGTVVIKRASPPTTGAPGDQPDNANAAVTDVTKEDDCGAAAGSEVEAVTERPVSPHASKPTSSENDAASADKPACPLFAKVALEEDEENAGKVADDMAVEEYEDLVEGSEVTHGVEAKVTTTKDPGASVSEGDAAKDVPPGVTVNDDAEVVTGNSEKPAAAGDVRPKSLKLAPQEEKLKSKRDSDLVFGLTTGHFDADIKLLRTCSEPDLSKLGRTSSLEQALYMEEEISLDDVDLDEQEALLEQYRSLVATADDASGDSEPEAAEGEESNTKVKVTVGPEEEEDEDEEEGDKPSGGDQEEEAEEDHSGESGETGEAADNVDNNTAESEDDDDMATMRESMMSLLEASDPPDDEPLVTTKKKKKITKKTKKVKKKKVKDSDIGAKSMSRQWSDGSAADLQSMRETMKSLLKPESDPSVVKAPTLKPVSEVGAAGDAGMDGADAAHAPSILPRSESWCSDEENDDDYFEEEDKFSRLEASRAQLEQRLGCETFLKAYKAVQGFCKQAIHEDEDENMEQGVNLVTSLLGATNVDLYPRILQLVMADGVFTEDND